MSELTNEEIRKEARAVFLLTLRRIRELVDDEAEPLTGATLQAILRFCSDNKLSLLNPELVKPEKPNSLAAVEHLFIEPSADLGLSFEDD